jgi:hypothetical protein
MPSDGSQGNSVYEGGPLFDLGCAFRRAGQLGPFRWTASAQGAAEPSGVGEAEGVDVLAHRRMKAATRRGHPRAWRSAPG